MSDERDDQQAKQIEDHSEDSADFSLFETSVKPPSEPKGLSRFLDRLGLFMAGFLLIVTYQNCGIERPSATTSPSLSAGSTVDHSAFVGLACASCHEKDRPAPVSGVAHGNGGDCASCHQAGAGWIIGGGAVGGVAFNHVPVPTSCTACHEKDRPAPVNGVAHGNGGDCVSCHMPGTKFQGGPTAFNHNPVPTSCTSCHEANRPAPVNGVAHGNGLDCVQCHTPGTTFKGGAKTFSHNPRPTSCNVCHETVRPPTATRMNQDPALSNNTHYGKLDCALCHTTPPAAVPFKYDHKNFQGARVTSCLPCHFNQGREEHDDNPEWFRAPIYDFANGKLGNCASCHGNGVFDD